jgi:hypothetical protein
VKRSTARGLAPRSGRPSWASAPSQGSPRQSFCATTRCCKPSPKGEKPKWLHPLVARAALGLAELCIGPTGRPVGLALAAAA